MVNGTRMNVFIYLDLFVKRIKVREKNCLCYFVFFLVVLDFFFLVVLDFVAVGFLFVFS